MRIWVFEDSEQDEKILEEGLKKLLARANLTCEIEWFRQAELPAGDPAALAFIDVELQEKSGLELASELKKRSPHLMTVLMSAFPHYSIQGYKTGAVRFLAKPLSDASLAETLDRDFLASLSSDPVLIHKSFPGGSLKASSVIYIEFTDRRTEAHLASGRVLSCPLSLREWAALCEGLPFEQCYKSILVNLAWVQEIDLPRMTILLKNGESIPLSRHYRKQFVQEYQFWLCSNL